MPAALTLEQVKERAIAKAEKWQAKKLEGGKELQTAMEPVAQAPAEGGQVPSRQRKTKSAFNGTVGKLQVDCSEIIAAGYHPHIINDTPGRIQQAIDNGYEFVKPDEVGNTSVNVTDRNLDLGDKIKFHVGTNDAGAPMYAYLMKIPQDWYDEDQAELQKRNDKIDDAIRKGKASDQSTDGFYVPKGGISYKT